ncbi:MAG: hypothetical protein Q4A15_07410 [Prevotellaceae bacterium]|nr:hypothetical protein [Prevotellaceae bacterium]
MNTIKSIIPFVSYLWIVIAVVAVWAWFYIDAQKKKNRLVAKRHWIETIPNAVSTLGVLGTFLGISLGLLCFNTQDLSSSIPQLLDGLKTAFFTSLAGMIGSLVLSKKINNLYDEVTGGTSDINQAAGLICKAVADLQEASTKQANTQSLFYNLMQSVVQNMDANVQNTDTNIETISANINNLSVAVGNIALTIQNVASATAMSAANIESIKDFSNNIEGATNSIITSVGNIEEIISRQVEFINSYIVLAQEINNRVGEITDHTEAMVSTEGEVSEKITGLKEKLHGEVVEIEDKMTETNALLERKFDEFSELLKKNNTEALVEVMKRVTEEFQTQMNALISKLVQENFDQLNKSVEKLNRWQQENKEMIQSLTSQYRQMADNFERTSTSLNKVKDDTKSLVSEGGKLDQLVNSLNEVIIKDEKFKEISSNLQKTADLSKSNMESFDESTRKLNDWVKKQRNFSDSVAVLIQKLDELNEMRNYASTFWKETKDGMNEAVGIIQNGSQTLNNQLTNLDQQFYARLSTTLAQLDACIQAIITNSENMR